MTPHPPPRYAFDCARLDHRHNYLYLYLYKVSYVSFPIMTMCEVQERTIISDLFVCLFVCLLACLLIMLSCILHVCVGENN